MKYNDIISYFESDEGITKLLGILQEDYFNVIDDYKDQFLQDILSTPDELKKAKIILAGIIASLEPIYSKALSLKKQKEYRYYVVKKENCEKEGTKFVDGSTEKESKDAVRAYRDIRDIICGYLRSATGLYFDAKDTLDRMVKEYGRTKDSE